MYFCNVTYMEYQTEKDLEKVVAKLLKKISQLGDIRPGTLSVQSRKKDGVAYGEYWHLNYTFKGKPQSRYVPEGCLKKVQKETENFKVFRELTEALTEASIALSDLRINAARKKAKEES